MLALSCTVTFPLLCYYPNMHARSLYKQYDYVDVPKKILLKKKCLFLVFETFRF